MKFTLICDESSTSDRYLIVGALTIPRTNHAILTKELLELKRSLVFTITEKLNGAKSARPIWSGIRNCFRGFLKN